MPSILKIKSKEILLMLFFCFGLFLFPNQAKATTIYDVANKDENLYISKTTPYANFANMGGMASGDINGDGKEDLAASSILEKVAKTESTLLPLDKDSWTEASAVSYWLTTTTKNTAPVADSSIYAAGTASISTTRTAVGSVNLKIRSSSPLSFVPATDILHLQIYAQDPKEQLSFIDLWDTNYNNRFRCNLSLPLNDSGWTQVDIPLSRFSVSSGTPSWSNITAVVLNFSGGSSGDIKIDQFYFNYTGPIKKKTGLVAVFFGPLTGDKAVAQADITIQGIDENDLTGEYLDVKDINNDGYKDIIIGTPYDDGPANGRQDAGAVYIIFGKPSIPAVIDLANGADYTIYGADPGDLLGETVYASDLNGDGVMDLVVGAQNSSGLNNSGVFNGEVHVFYGPFTKGGVVDLNSSSANISIFGKPYDFLGFQATVSSGDFYNDGQKDLIFGLNRGENPPYDSGRVVIINNISNYTGVIDLTAMAPATVINGADVGDKLCKIAVTDFNNDGIDDILMGAEKTDGVDNAKADAGEAYIIFGSSTLPSSINLNTYIPNLRIIGKDVGDGLGIRLAAGDVNGDGIGDVLINAAGDDGPLDARSNSGAGYVFYGGASWQGVIDLSVISPDIIIYGADSSDNLRDAYIADVSGDGIKDILLGFRDADGLNNAYMDSGEIIGINGRQ